MPRRPADIRRELAMARHWLREDLTQIHPVSDPVAYAINPDAAVGIKLREALHLPTHGHVSAGWLPRAELLETLRAISASDALLLERASSTDVGRWTVLYADVTFRVALESLDELAALVMAPPPAGCIVGLAKCIDGDEHSWDAEVELDEGEEPETACSVCGVLIEMWLIHHVGW